jgi:hypothetical protein
MKHAPDEIINDPDVAEARHALGNRKTAVGMIEQLLPRTTDPER